MTEQKAERRAVDEVGGHPRSVALGERTQYKLKPSPSTRARVRRAYQNTEHNMTLSDGDRNRAVRCRATRLGRHCTFNRTVIKMK